MPSALFQVERDGPSAPRLDSGGWPPGSSPRNVAVLARLLANSPLAGIADASQLATTISAAFIGIELFEGVDAAAASGALDALERMAVLVEVADELGPAATRLLRRRIARRTRARR